jgi:glycosyltransferase involved in cell wall biosynthesis
VPGNTLLLFHCGSNTGYAIETLERTFDLAARSDARVDVHYAYADLKSGHPSHLSDVRSEVAEISYHASSAKLATFAEWVRAKRVSRVLAFDLPVRANINRALRQAGVTRVVSYWGASISDIFPWYLRPARRIQYLLQPDRPDHFIFESSGMLERATKGACIPRRRASVCNIGIDVNLYRPLTGSKYAHQTFSIPTDRQIVFFSGHMEERKGVHVLIKAFAQIPEVERESLHLLLAGNTSEDESRLSSLLHDPKVRERVTFAGYRRDIPRLLQSVSLGVIASTGWDSFTVSAVEMAACGVPLVVSDLPGLRDAVVPGVTGERSPVGRPDELATTIARLMGDKGLRDLYGRQSRERVLREFSLEGQVRTIAEILYA